VERRVSESAPFSGKGGRKTAPPYPAAFVPAALKKVSCPIIYYTYIFTIIAFYHTVRQSQSSMTDSKRNSLIKLNLFALSVGAPSFIIKCNHGITTTIRLTAVDPFPFFSAQTGGEAEADSAAWLEMR
jgi:hypothetical protein